MKRAASACLLLLAATSAVAADRTMHPFGTLRLGALLDSEISYGCGWSFTPVASESQILQWSIDEPASMFLQDRLVRLMLTRESGKAEKVGDARDLRLEGDGVVVEAALKTSWTCPPEDDSCEVVEFTGDLKVTAAGATVTIPVEAESGC